MAPVAPAPGDVIEDYELLEKIGGNMGLVFKARHRLLDKIVALKLFPADSIADPARLARFQRELRVMGQLQHPNLVTAADARIARGWHLVSMELIDGMDLLQLVDAQGPLPIAAACEIARQAALALQHAYQHGLIHRDIKPSNLMLTRSGHIKVIDMGLALTREEPTALLTQTGLVMGTMNYCAPEQFRDASRVDIRADIYSLGCTLYHLLTGKSPYSQRTTFAEVVQAHLNEPFPAITEMRSDAPASIQAVLARMTAKDPGSRFATPAEVAEALAPLAHGADTKHLLPATLPQDAVRPAEFRKPGRDDSPRRGSAVPVTVLPAAPHAREPAVARRQRRSSPTSGEHRRKGQRRRIIAALLLLLVIAAAVFFVSGFWKSDPIVVLMDTTAPRGVYDEDNRLTGGNNAQELTKVLGDLLPRSLRSEPISLDWHRDAQVLAMHPRLVLVHRSAFFHPMNEKLQLGYPPFANPADEEKYMALYRIGDDRLRDFMSFIGYLNQRTEFLVYSRGTDKQWPDENYRKKWVNDLETQFPGLRGRITPILIPGGTGPKGGSFRDPETRQMIRDHVKRILGLREKRD